jgi:hypothetical protein
MTDSAKGEHVGVRVPASVAMAVDLVVQILVAGVLFLAIGAMAIALNFATDQCEIHNLGPKWFTFGMRAMEVALWTLDLACCLLLMLREAWVFCTRVLYKGT